MSKTEIKSKFRWSIALLIGILCNLIVVSIMEHYITGLEGFWLVLSLDIFFGLIAFWIIYGELRRKATVLYLKDEAFSCAYYLGFGKARYFLWSEFEGFETCDLPSNIGTYEYLFLIKDSKRSIVISSFYHKNYDEMKQFVEQKLPDLGKRDFNLKKEFKEILNK